MYYVYIIFSVEYDEWYVGSTNDLQNRIHDHNSGKNLHTKKYKPWKLVHYSAFKSKTRALEFERYLKTGSGRAFSRKHLR